MGSRCVGSDSCEVVSYARCLRHARGSYCRPYSYYLRVELYGYGALSPPPCAVFRLTTHRCHGSLLPSRTGTDARPRRGVVFISLIIRYVALPCLLALLCFVCVCLRAYWPGRWLGSRIFYYLRLGFDDSLKLRSTLYEFCKPAHSPQDVRRASGQRQALT